MGEVNPTVEAALAWLDREVEAGNITHERARLIGTSVRRLVSVRRDDEPDSLRWLDANRGDVAKRLPVSDGTVYSYMSRTRTLAREMGVAGGSRSTVGLRGSSGDLVLPNGRRFSYQAPARGLSRSDVQRISMALWAASPEFDGGPLIAVTNGSREPLRNDTKTATDENEPCEE